MDVIILAGGYATRLWPVTKHRPKMLLPVGESTVLDRILAELEPDNRVEDVYLSTNQRFAEEFRHHLAVSEFAKPRLSVEQTTQEDGKLGVIGALAQLVEREGLDDDTMVIAGDNLFDFDLSRFIDFFQAAKKPCLAAHDIGSYERATSYGVVELEGDRIIDFQEKPEAPDSTLVAVACYAYPADVLPLLNEYIRGNNNPDEPGWFIQWLYQRQAVHAFSFDESWFDIGTPDSYLDAISWTLGGGSRVADTVSLENAVVGENVHLMDGVTVKNSYIENSVVFPNATIEDCDLYTSIIDENTLLRNQGLKDALIGPNIHLDSNEEPAPALSGDSERTSARSQTGQSVDR